MALWARGVFVVALLCCCVGIAGCSATETTTTTYLIDTGVTTTSDVPPTTTSTAEAVHLYRVEVDNKWGFIDDTGAVKIEPAFDAAYSGFSEGLAPVDPAGDDSLLFGYIDTSGAMVIEPRFPYADVFVEGLAVVGSQDQGEGGKWGAIDRTGALVVPMGYDLPPYFSEGLAAIRSGHDWNFIDTAGAVVLGPFNAAGSFSEDLAYVDWGDGRGYIDKSGRRVIELPAGLSGDDWPEKGFFEGLAVVRSQEGETTLYGYIDTSGELVIEPQFVRASAFSGGLAAAAVEIDGRVRSGLIDKTGAWVIEPRFDGISPFSEGLAVVVEVGSYAGVDDFETYGYIDKTGSVVIPMQYSEAGSFSGGIAAVLFRDARSGSPNYIDKTGRVIWPAGGPAASSANLAEPKVPGESYEKMIRELLTSRLAQEDGQEQVDGRNALRIVENRPAQDGDRSASIWSTPRPANRSSGGS